jgi:hypothetical protein
MTTRRWSVMLVLALTLALTMPVATQAITAREFFRLFPFGIFDPPFFGDLFFIDPNTVLWVIHLRPGDQHRAREGRVVQGCSWNRHRSAQHGRRGRGAPASDHRFL